MSKIAEFLSNKTVLITGATGFLGQPLVEKILWSAPDIRRIYVLIRPKRQLGGSWLDAQERLERELYRSSVFERLQIRDKSRFDIFLREKVVAVHGDISQDGLAIKEEEAEQLRKEIDIVINSAAVVSFDAGLSEALELNVLGAKRLTQFASGCRSAKLVHVSTAYVCGATDGSIPETTYHQAPDDAEDGFPQRQFTNLDREIEKISEIIGAVFEHAQTREFRRELAEAFVRKSRKNKRRRKVGRRQEIERLKAKWLKNQLSREGMKWARERGWNDTYTYTKALGEQMVLRYRGEMPVAIVRPSIIESSLSEPSPGWLDGLRMADPLIVAIGKGRLRSLPLNPEVKLDLVPVDVVVNAILAAIPELTASTPPLVFQVATGSKNPILIGDLYDLILEYFRKNPMLDKEGNAIRVRPLKFPKPAAFRLRHRLRSVPLNTAKRTLERLPVFDGSQRAKRRISATKAAHDKLFHYGELYEPYLNLHCNFEVDQLLALHSGLDEDDQETFNFDVARLNWRHYIQNVHIPGVKKYILKIEGTGTLGVEEVHPDAASSPSTINELLAHAAEKHAAKTALQTKRDGKWVRYSYTAVQKKSEEIGERFLELGLQKGDRIVLFSENRPEWGICYLGAVAAGLIVVPLDAQAWHREVWSVSAFTEARALMLTERCLERLPEEGLRSNEAAAAPVLLLNVNQLGRSFSLAQYPRSSSPEKRSKPARQPTIEAADAVSIIFTTGTAADPKGVVHTHRSFLNNLRGVNHYLSVSESDQLLSVLPLYHALEFTCGFLMAVHGGATITYSTSLKPKMLLQAMRETGTTCMLGVPTLFTLLRDDAERRILRTSKSVVKTNLMQRSKQLSRSVEERLGRNIGRRLFAQVHQEFGNKIRVFVSGGSRLGRNLYRDFRAMGLPIYEGYGLTETGPVLTVNPLHRSKEGSAGMPLPGVEMRIFRPDEDGIGEIIVRTPSIMKEYYKNPEATAAVLRNGWFHTGDLGWVDADGYIYITGRIKDVIVTGAGKNVYPADLEAIYRESPSVKEICVIGVRKGLTEDIHAAVFPKAASHSTAQSKEERKRVQKELQALGKELPSYHRLQAIHLWPEPLPRDRTGSIDRELIQSQILNEDRATRPQTLTARSTSSEASLRETLVQELSRLSGIEPEEIDERAHLYTDLALDSLMALELLLFLEHHFAATIPDESATSFETVGDVLDELRRRGLGTDISEQKEESGAERFAFRRLDRPAMNRAVMSASFSGLKTFFRSYFGLELKNEDVLPQGGAYIMAANHSSHLDTAAIISALSIALGKTRAQQLHVVGAQDYFFNSPLRSWVFSNCLNVVPIERDEVSLGGLRRIRAILAAGQPVLIFPEGTRSRDGSLQEFRPGIGLIAYETRVPIVPAYLSGTHAALPPGKTLPRRTRITVAFGSPILIEDYVRDIGEGPNDEIYRRITSDVRSAVELLADNASSNSGTAS